MCEMRAVDFKHLANYLASNTTQPIADGVLKDVAQNLSLSNENAVFTVQKYPLGARARPSEMDVIAITTASGAQRKRLSYLIKPAHHLSEAARSAKAAECGLGPPLIAIDGIWICERLFDKNDSWQAKARNLDVETGKYLGACLAEKVSLMFTINLHHRFDDFPEHTFILHSHANTDVRWIDWAKGFSLESAGPAAEFLIQSHMAVLLDHLRNVEHAAIVYHAFRKTIAMLDTEALHLTEIINKTEKSLAISDSRFPKQWSEFLAAVKVIAHDD